jgi:uncharacterized zinc-type alcohol dehydrogenase-like protein
MRRVQGLMADAPGTALRLWDFERRDLRADDVAVRVRYCGVCHTDLHALHALDGSPGTTPLVPGHEFVGEVAAVGSAVTRFTVGETVAVGNIVDSCGVCVMCRADQENYCVEFPTLTYSGTDRQDGTPTYGGYSTEYVATERFVYHVPEGLDLAAVAPLMCAGITVWEPLRRWNVGPGMRVGVVGLGGLGHLALKFAHALGAQVSLFTTSAGKATGARELGAEDVIVSTDPAAMAAQVNRFDFILDTASAPHDLSPYLRALRLDGTLCTVGSINSMEFEPLSLLIGRKSLAGAGSGGTAGTQAMLDFCGQHGITADVEVLPAREVQTALARLERNDVRYRFVLDMTAM